MSTQITPSLLTELRATGRHAAAEAGPFVDPTIVAKVKRIIDRRGEPWVASILGRDLTRRSLAFPTLPWLNDGDLHTILAADVVEDRVQFDRITNPPAPEASA